MSKLKVSVLVMLVTLSSCAVGPNYCPPKNNVPNWVINPKVRHVIKEDPINISWWKQFNDPVLNHLIEQAIANNLDIKTAEENIKSARALRQISAAAYYPQVDANAAYQSKRISIRGTQIGFFRGLNPDLVYLRRKFYDGGFDASWELDLFGRTKRSVELQDAYIGQEVAIKHQVLLTVIAEVARNYLEFRGTQQLMGYTEKNIVLQKRNFTFINERFKAGEDNNLNVELAKNVWVTTEAQLPNLKAQMQASADRIAVLLGLDPQTILHELHASRPLHIPTQKVPVGLRSEILERRPDVIEAERVFAQAIASVGISVADQYPRFTIVGNIGVDSVSLSKLFYSNSSTWLFGPAVSLPIFKGGALRANVANKKALANAAFYQYQGAVLAALQDADTSITNYAQELATYKRLRASVTSNHRSVILAQDRYHTGEDDVLSLITAERSFYDAQINLINSHTRALTKLVSLYKALGGGWEVSNKSQA